jgi:Tfp pilus assembly protein PilF
VLPCWRRITSGADLLVRLDTGVFQVALPLMDEVRARRACEDADWGTIRGVVRAFRFPSSPRPGPDSVREHLATVVRSAPFARSNRLQRFLAFIVECELSDRRRDIQEYTIGLEVFDRGESFDPRSDSIVRVEARRLRKRLKQYYAGEGRREPVRIVMPQRGYLPSFEHRRLRPVRIWYVAGVLAMAVILAVISYMLSGSHPSYTPTAPAREAFEKGRAAFDQWTGEGARQAEAFFSQAIAHDPGYARAFAWLSAAYRQQAIMGDVGFLEIHPRSLEAARKAVALEPELADAHQMLAVSLTFEPRWRDAEEEFRTAIRIDPDKASVHHAYGIGLLAASAARLADAEAELRAAARLEPRNLSHRVVLAKILYFRGRLDEARAILEEVLRIDPYFADAMRNLAAVLVQTGEYANAIRFFGRAQELANLPWGEGLLGYAHALSGDRSGAQAMLAALEEKYALRPVGALAVATVQVGLGQTARACESLHRAWTNREFRMRYVGVDPIYASLSDQPCFTSLVDEMAVAEIATSH